MAKKKAEDKEVPVESVPEETAPVDVEQALPDVWPENTYPKTREIMEAHGIMGPRQMDADWPRAEAIFKAHGIEWKAPEQ